MHPLATYLRALHDIRSSGSAVEETSYYGTLEQLLNEIGKSLKPKVRCIINLKNKGAGIPDGGLFTPDQLQRRTPRAAETDDLLEGMIPARGAIEVKGTKEDVAKTASSEQVAKYLKRYGQVLVTNYRDFVLVGQEDGKPVQLEAYQLAPSEKAFWRAASTEQRTAAEQGERLVEYLKRVMLHRAQLSEPRDLAWFLASYARDARARVEAAPDVSALQTIRDSLEQALGIRFEGERGEHFFRSTLVQTLFYGIFSAWVLWSRQHAPADRAARFNWKEAEWTLHVPMIRALFEQLATPSKLGALNLVEVMEWTEVALNQVDRAAFFKSFEHTRAVQYFYEPFLEAFDPELRKELGVWYTPPEIVKYMVARVDTVLREELDIADGLADPRVYVLDPCCGTGAYLVEVLRRISDTLHNKGGDALAARDVKRAATERVFGFEILPAPFVVAHLQLGLLLQQMGVPFSGAKEERAGVYLTNALTGWEPPKGGKQHLLLPELEEEREAADKVKREVPILVILGNPPYNGFAGMAIQEERELSTAYRTTKRAPKPQGQGLNDLYVRFFRMAERKIVEGTGRGVVCFISNYSWLDGLSFTGMRERYLEVFDRVWIDNLHGDRVISEYAPDGRTSETVFALDGSSPGIRIGTAIALLTVGGGASRTESSARLNYKDWEQARAEERTGALIESLTAPESASGYSILTPVLQIGLPFRPRALSENYLSWPLLTELLPTSFPGVKTSRDDVVVDIDRERLAQRMMKYFDPEVSHEEMVRISPGAMTSTARFKAETTRDALRKRGFLPDKIVRYCYRPFDVRWLYWEPETKLLDEKRADYVSHVFAKDSTHNLWIEARQKQPMERFDRGYALTVLGDNFGNGLSNFFPLYLKQNDELPLLSQDPALRKAAPNLSSRAVDYLHRLGIGERELFGHLLAILHAPAYRVENAGALSQDWPRVPLPAERERMSVSFKLGRQLAELLNPEIRVGGLGQGRIRAELKEIARVTRAGGGALNPDAGDLELTAGWGHGGKGGVTMPGKGRLLERDYTDEERGAMNTTAVQFGPKTLDVFLNDVAYWQNIPARVWEYTISGYQVIKKWLSYRERDLLGRSLTVEEVRFVQEMARRIAAILMLEPELDANYQAVKEATYPLEPFQLG